MEKLSAKLEETLLLTKALANCVNKEERFGSLNEVIDNVLENGALDRDAYFHGIMELTQIGLVCSDIETEEDIEMSQCIGFDIQGITEKGEAYISTLQSRPNIIDFFKKVDEICNKVAETGVFKLTSGILLPALSLIMV